MANAKGLFSVPLLTSQLILFLTYYLSYFLYKKEWARDKRNRKRLKNLELTSRINKYLFNNDSYVYRSATYYFLKRKMNRYGYSLVVRRCVLSGRAHGLVSDFGLSRHKFKHVVERGLLSGVTKASW